MFLDVFRYIRGTLVYVVPYVDYVIGCRHSVLRECYSQPAAVQRPLTPLPRRIQRLVSSFLQSPYVSATAAKTTASPLCPHDDRDRPAGGRCSGNDGRQHRQLPDVTHRLSTVRPVALIHIESTPLSCPDFQR